MTDVGERIAVEHEDVGQVAVPMCPSSCARPIKRAPFRVDASRTWRVDSPDSTISCSSRCSDEPCNVPVLPASVPATITAPASASRFRLRC